MRMRWMLGLVLLAACGADASSCEEDPTCEPAEPRVPAPFLSAACEFSETLTLQGEPFDAYRTRVSVPEGAEVVGYTIGWTLINLVTGEVDYDPTRSAPFSPKVDGTTASQLCRAVDRWQMVEYYYDEVRFYVTDTPADSGWIPLECDTPSFEDGVLVFRAVVPGEADQAYEHRVEGFIDTEEDGYDRSNAGVQPSVVHGGDRVYCYEQRDDPRTEVREEWLVGAPWQFVRLLRTDEVTR